MDIWGAGCVMFEILTLVPLFPGKNELDMIHRIHNILGTPSQKVLDRFKRHASHMDFNFPEKVGSGLEKLLPHVTPDCLDLLNKMLTYDPEKRISSDQVLSHEYFRELLMAERMSEFQTTLSSASLSSGYQGFQQPPQDNKTHYQQSSNKKNISPLQLASTQAHKFTNVKHDNSHKTNYMHSTSGDDYDKISSLPPLKQQHHTQAGHDGNVKYGFGPMSNASRKKENIKGLAGVFLKSHNPHHLQKKPQKLNSINHEYFVMGKKAG
jgi:renal tumor antigen